jgi:tetratricopeptide (TPR) repeat protein
VAYAAAAEFYAAAAARLEAAGRAGEVVPITEKHGGALYLAGRYDAAITALEDALERYQAVGDAEAAARVTGRLAHAHYRAGTSGDALGPLGGLADTGAAPMPGTASPGALAQWEGRLLLLYAQGAYEEIAAAGRALARAGRTAGNQQMQATGTRVEGVGLICLGQLLEGTTLMAAALSAEPVPIRAVDTTALLSGAYLAMGLPGRCQAVSEPMLAVAEHAGDQVAAAMHTAMLAGACYVRGDWHRGRDLVERARQRFAASSPPMAVRAVGILASALTWHGDWDQARDYLDGCLRSARSLQIVHSERSALAYLAELDTLDGRPRDALTRLHPVTAGHSPPATEDLTWNYAVLLLSVLATAHLELDDLPLARAYARRAVSQARTTGAWMQGIRALEVDGMIQARDGHYDLARAAYTEGLHRAEAMPSPYGQARLLHAHALLDRQQHDHAAGHARLAQALAILDSLGADQDAARLRQAIADTPRSG